MTTITANSAIGITLLSPAYISPVVIDAGVTIASSTDGIDAATGYWIIQSAGLIAANATSGTGIDLTAGGSITNQAGGTISGYVAIVANAPLTVVNAGTIAGTETTNSGAGIDLTAGGIVTNQSSGSITGILASPVSPPPAGVTVLNAGTITGNTASSVLSKDRLAAVELGGRYGGLVSNQSGGVIRGVYGVRLDNVFTAVNAGLIAGDTASGAGVYLALEGDFIFGRKGSDLTNQSGGTISGQYGVVTGGAYGRFTVVNAGSIAGNMVSGGGIQETSSFADDKAAQFGIGGNVTNQSGGTITGLDAVHGVGTLVVVNAGLLAGNAESGAGVRLETDSKVDEPGPSDGQITNRSGGTISGFDALGTSGEYGREAVLNAGLIVANPTAGTGIFLGGVVTAAVSNQPGGTITGYRGIYSSGRFAVGFPGFETGTVDVTNAGSIAGFGSASIAIELGGGGALSNATTGSITGGRAAIQAGFPLGNGRYGVLSVINAGVITGTAAASAGIALTAGGQVTNTGTITGGAVGITIQSGGTVANAGTIEGADDAVLFQPGYANRVIVSPGAAFTGRIEGGNTIGAAAASTLELASGSSAGALFGLGTRYTDFAQIVVDPNADWSLTGTETIVAGQTLSVNAAILTDAGILTNNGTILLDPSSMTVGALTGTGAVTIATGSTLTVLGTISAGQTIAFTGPGAELILNTPAADAGTVTGFATGDAIDLTNLPLVTGATATVANDILSVASGDTTDHLPISGIPDGTAFTARQDAAGTGTEVIPCFLPGTLIRTDRGEIAIEKLKQGDTILTISGRPRRLCWIGRGQALATRGRRGPATPVILRKGALADNVPHEDLRLTKGHAVYLDGVLIPIEFLINHRSILWDDRAQEVTVFHLELDAHDVLLANGAPSESYRDDGNRWLFRNANSAWTRPPEPPCAPVLTGGAIVDTLWRRLLDRAGPRPNLPLTEDPDVHLVANGIAICPTTQTNGVYLFVLLNPTGYVRIVSNSAVPQEIGLARDSRCLGIALRRIIIRQGTRFRIVAASDPRLAHGFHKFEPDPGLRWTNGDAVLPAGLFADLHGLIELVLQVGASTRYIAAPPTRTAA